MRNRKAFTLIELMIVIAIIAIIAAIAIPGILSARKSANASSAFANLKAFCTAMAVYQNEDKEQKYPEAGAYGTEKNGGLFGKYFNHLDIKSGYKYQYATADDLSQFVYYACPTSANNGKKVYVTDESNRIWEYTSAENFEDIVISGELVEPAGDGGVWEVPGPERVTWTQTGATITATDFIQKT